MTDISPEIINILENDFKTFMMVCIKKEDLNEILKDPVCNGVDDVVYFFNLYFMVNKTLTNNCEQKTKKNNWFCSSDYLN